MQLKKLEGRCRETAGVNCSNHSALQRRRRSWKVVQLDSEKVAGVKAEITPRPV